MTNLYLDIETLPTDRDDVKAYIADKITPPGNIKKEESIQKWVQESKPEAINEAVSKTGLDGAFGRICCVGMAFENEPIITIYGDEEATILHQFVEIIGEDMHRIIGHNVAAFDIRFLWQRAMVNSVKMPWWFPRDPKPWGNDVFDTMTAFAGTRNMIGLDRLCLALGLPGKSDIDGSMVADLWANGEREKVSEYCKQDVERTRAVHRKMMIAFGEAGL